MTEKYLLVNLYDEKSKKIAEILGNKTCKKIIEHLSEIKEISEKDLADKLKLRINTVEYNLKKLTVAGLVEKTKNFFWSKKGKKIPTYKLAKKHILISPKATGFSSKLKSLLPAAIFSLIGSFVLKKIFETKEIVAKAGGSDSFSRIVIDSIEEQTITDPTNQGANFIMQNPLLPIWVWFLIGSFLAIIVFALVNWRKL